VPKLKLTARAVSQIKAPDPSGRQQLFWDTEIKGLAVLVSGTTSARTYVVQRTIGAKGPTRRLTIGPVNTIDLEQAKDLGADMLNDLRRGIDPKAKTTNWTLKEALDGYIAARKDLRPTSIRAYRNIERTLADWLDTPLRDITADMVEAKHVELAAAIEAAAERRRSVEERANARQYSGQSSANMTMRTLRVIYNFVADRVADMPPNPVRRLKRQWYAEPRRTRLVRSEDLPRFYTAVKAMRNEVARDYILLLLFSGLRKTEAATLKWTDVDFAERVIRIRASATKGNRKLDLPMCDVVRNILVARRALGDSGFVFPGAGESGRLWDPGLAAIKKATGIEISAHDLRRTYVTVAESTDISPIAIKALINHSVGSDVTSGYVVISTERLREAAQRVCDRLKALCGVEEVAGDNVARL
jgi:integrase